MTKEKLINAIKDVLVNESVVGGSLQQTAEMILSKIQKSGAVIYYLGEPLVDENENER